MSQDLTPAQSASLDQSMVDIDRASQLEMKVASTLLITEINKDSIERNYNRTFEPADLEDLLDPDGWHVVKPIMYHHHAQGQEVPEHLRCQMFLKMRGASEPEYLILDMTQQAYDALEPASTLSRG